MIRHFLQLVAQLGTLRYKCSSSHPMVQLAVQPCGVHVPVRDSLPRFHVIHDD